MCPSPGLHRLPAPRMCDLVGLRLEGKKKKKPTGTSGLRSAAPLGTPFSRDAGLPDAKPLDFRSPAGPSWLSLWPSDWRTRVLGSHEPPPPGRCVVSRTRGWSERRGVRDRRRGRSGGLETRQSWGLRWPGPRPPRVSVPAGPPGQRGPAARPPRRGWDIKAGSE